MVFCLLFFFIRFYLDFSFSLLLLFCFSIFAAIANWRGPFGLNTPFEHARRPHRPPLHGALIPKRRSDTMPRPRIEEEQLPFFFRWYEEEPRPDNAAERAAVFHAEGGEVTVRAARRHAAQPPPRVTRHWSRDP